MTGTNLATLLGLLVPLLVAVVANCKTSGAVKGTLAAVFSVATGAIITFNGYIPNLEAVAGSIIAVVVLAQASYNMFWKPLGVTSWILEHVGNKAAE